MKTLNRILLLILVYLLSVVSAFGFLTYFYKIAAFKSILTQLYLGIGGAIASLIAGAVLVLSGGRKTAKPAEKAEAYVPVKEVSVEEPAREEEKPAAALSKVGPGEKTASFIAVLDDDDDDKRENLDSFVIQEPDWPDRHTEELETALEAEETPETDDDFVLETEFTRDNPVVEDDEEIIEQADEEIREAEEEEEDDNKEDDIVISDTFEVPTVSGDEVASSYLDETINMNVLSDLSEAMDREPAMEKKEASGDTFSYMQQQLDLSSRSVSSDVLGLGEDYVDDTTAVINTVPFNNPFKDENNYDVDQKVEDLKISIPTVEMETVKEEETKAADLSEKISTMETFTNEMAVVDDFGELLEMEAEPEPEEEILRPQEKSAISESMDNGFDLTSTQQTYINQSKVSYIDETGMPQFKITQKIQTVSDDTEVGEEDYKRHYERESKAERLSGILNKIIVVLFVGLILLGMYILFIKFFG